MRWGDLLDKAADLYPNEEALIDDRKRLTYAQVREDVGSYDLSSLKKVSVGGATSTPDLVKKVQTKLGCKFISGFGSVEGTIASCLVGTCLPPVVIFCK